MKNLKKLFLPVLAAAFLAAPAQAADTLMMATTTSTQDTGLLEFLAPTFQKETGIELKWVAVGTGKALEIAKNCDADVLLVHAPAAAAAAAAIFIDFIECPFIVRFTSPLPRSRRPSACAACAPEPR